MTANAPPHDAVPPAGGEPAVYGRSGPRLAAEGLSTEWVLTNGLGGFAMGTAAGIPTRRYHALLIGAMRPPVDRVAALAGVAETLILGEQRVHLGVYHFASDGVRALRHPWLEAFSRGPGWCEWVYRAHGTTLTKRLVLLRGRNACALSYRVRTGGTHARLELRPLVALRDFHGLNAPDAVPAALPSTTAGRETPPPHEDPDMEPTPGGVVVSLRGARLRLLGEGLALAPVGEWWRGFEYCWEFRRGQDGVEDLFVPGVFSVDLADGAGGAELFAAMDDEPAERPERELERRRARLEALTARTIALASGDAEPAPEDRRDLARLAAAGDDFVVRRGPVVRDRAQGVSVIAGYPWFADWGRDTMICLPGLFLATGRFEEALGVLATFAAHRRGGIIPNRFDDYGGEPHYNTVDASLWFLHAACAYRRASNDHAGFLEHLAPACLDVIRSFTQGTEYDIRVDPADHLVAAGNPETQLTWMDAKRDGVTFTPRHGKAVEINALWIHGLRSIADALAGDDPATASRLRTDAERAQKGFQARLWDKARGVCFDRLEPDGAGGWTPSGEVRPNMVFAASLRHGPLDAAQRRAVLDATRRLLVAPEGLRTLAPGSEGYRPRFEGPLFERDGAYHNGTVWPWLKGAYIEGELRAGSFSREACAQARALLRPWLDLIDSETIGSIAEVFDADEPRRPDGCMAQAWSVAEALRVLALVLAAERGQTGL